MDISNNELVSSPAAPAGRRKSGRAVKVPEKFVPEVASSQAAGNAKAKRKRGDEIDENDASDLDEEEEQEEEEGDGESAAESVAEEEKRQSQKKKKTKGTRKPAAKKPKINGTAEHAAAPAVKLPTRPKKSKRVFVAEEEVEGLYADVFTSKKSLDDVATQWMHRFKEHGPEALTELVNMILKSFGCELEVTVHDINDPDNAATKLGDLEEEYQAQTISEYPLIARGKSATTFRAALTEFFDQLTQVLHASNVLYTDPELMESISAWLAPMSSSSSRPFRHTSTLIALTITSSLCRIANLQADQAGKLQRQLEGEKKKRGGNKARVADIQNKVAENEENKEIVLERIRDMYSTIYILRYRDVDPRIRVECAEALGDWITTLESMFFDGEYLRYMGWMLSDSHGSMRHEVVKQITKIMKALNAGGMRHFIERFRSRIVEIATRDSEPAVRVSAVELMDLIRAAGMLEPDDIDVVGKLIFDTEPRVRKAVVPFFTENIKDLYESIVEDIGEDALEEVSADAEPDDFDRPRPVWIRYKCLAECLLSYDIQDQEDLPSQIEAVDILHTKGNDSRFTLAAQALYDKLPGLKDWEVLAGYLLYDHTSNASAESEAENAFRSSFKPEDKEELILLEVLNAVVKVSLTQHDETDRTKKKPTRTETAEAKEATARKLAGLIPRLLKKYGADPKTATVVLRLEHVLNLGVFQELRQDSTVYAKLLDEISAQFNGHADKNVLTEAGAALLHARGYEELEEVTENKMNALWEDTTSALLKFAKAGPVSVRGSFKDRIIRDLSHNLARLEQLASISDCVDSLEADNGSGGASPAAILIDIVARGQYVDSNDDTIDALEDEVVQSAIRSAMFYFMWKVRYLSGVIEGGEAIEDIVIDQLRELQDTFVNNLILTFSSRATLDLLRLLGAGTYLDLHTLFATLRSTPPPKSSTNTNTNHLLTLMTEVPPEVQTELTSIFDGLEKQFAKRSKKKLLEPDEDEAPQDLDSDPEDEEEYEDAVTDSERQAEILKAEQQLCEFTGKLVLAILAKVIDVSGPLKGRLRKRIERNRLRLGPNFKEIVTYLDDVTPRAAASKKSHKSKAQQAAIAQKKAMKSAETVDDDENDEGDEDEEDERHYTDVENKEGTAVDLRRRELLDEGDGDDELVNPEDEGEEEAAPLEEGEEEGEGGEGGGDGDAEEQDEDDDDIMGD